MQEEDSFLAAGAQPQRNQNLSQNYVKYMKVRFFNRKPKVMSIFPYFAGLFFLKNFFHYSHWNFTLLLSSNLKASLGHHEQHYLFIIKDSDLKVYFYISNSADQTIQARENLF